MRAGNGASSAVSDFNRIDSHVGLCSEGGRAASDDEAKSLLDIYVMSEYSGLGRKCYIQFQRHRIVLTSFVSFDGVRVANMGCIRKAFSWYQENVPAQYRS